MRQTFRRSLRQKPREASGDEEKGGYAFKKSFITVPLSAFRGLDMAKLKASEIGGVVDHSGTDGQAAIMAEALIAGFCGGASKGPRFTIAQAAKTACYMPGKHEISISDRRYYKSLYRYFKTAFHEMIHSTGHADLLARDTITGAGITFGDHDYSREELIAELGAVMLAGRCGFIAEIEDVSAAYMAGWLKILKADPKLLLQSAKGAQKAADLIWGSVDWAGLGIDVGEPLDAEIAAS